MRESESDVARLLWRSASRVVVVTVTYTEARAALAAAERAGRISRLRHDDAKQALERRWRQADVIVADDAVVRMAGDVAEAYSLRPLDALQLTAALASEDPELVFATWDRELAAAASAAGFAVAP